MDHAFGKKMVSRKGAKPASLRFCVWRSHLPKESLWDLRDLREAIFGSGRWKLAKIFGNPFAKRGMITYHWRGALRLSRSAFSGTGSLRVNKYILNDQQKSTIILSKWRGCFAPRVEGHPEQVAQLFRATRRRTS